jgi:hypothetical protein
MSTPEITAKIICNLKSEFGEGEHRLATVSFCPDYAAGRNQEWSASTPHLDLRMTVKGAVADLFKQGQNYTLTFTPEA